MSLHDQFLLLVQRYPGGPEWGGLLWQEIEKHYSARGRYYHTLAHLEHLQGQLEEVRSQLEDVDTVLFSLFYHDIVYRVMRSDNEEKSSERAGKRLVQLGFPPERTARCQAQILATKSHRPSTDHDANFFTDADLSILGQDWETYAQYARDVRREYAVYPDLLYNPGRKKVLDHFLAMEKIFKTDYFYGKLENRARENLRRERDAL